jgi:uncharacterized protein YifE (UPF0438 family)
VRLNGPERKLLERRGTRLKAYEENKGTRSSSDEYKHFMKVLQAYEERSISSSDAYKQFMKLCEDNAEAITEEERVWLKYRTMLEEEKRLKEQHEAELKNSPERKEYIKSRLVP